MPEDLKPGIPRKPLAQVSAPKPVKPDTSYVDMAMDRPYAAASSGRQEATSDAAESNAHNEHWAKIIESVGNLPELFTFLDSITGIEKGIKDSIRYYQSSQLIQQIMHYVETGSGLSAITNGAGLRDRVLSLTIAEENRFRAFGAIVGELKKGLSLLPFRRHVLNQILRRNNLEHETIAIHYQSALLGTVTSPTTKYFNETAEFEAEVRKLLREKAGKLG